MPKSRFHRQVAEAESSDIIVYPNRRGVTGWFAAFLVLAFICALFFLFMLVIVLLIPEPRAATSVLLAMFGGFLAICVWETWVLGRLLFAGEPLLVINRSGVRVGKMFGSSNIFLAWEEIEAIQMNDKLLCIRPVDYALFYARLRLLTRMICRLNTTSGAPIIFYQSFLDKPIEEIARQVRARYARELAYHRTRRKAENHAQAGDEKREMVFYTSKKLLWVPVFLGIPFPLGLVLLFQSHWRFPTLLYSLIFMLGGISFSSLMAWNILRKPVLIIDEEGIASPRILGSTKLRWEELDSLYTVVAQKRLLVVDVSPAGVAALLERRTKGGRVMFTQRADVTVPQTALQIPENWLPISIARLFINMNTRFRDQLDRYHIQIEDEGGGPL